jgi:hypothetical protein
MSELHNRLLDAFKAATHSDLSTQDAVERLTELHDLLEVWTSAMNYALKGDLLATGTILMGAQEKALSSSTDTGAPSGRYVAVVRHGDLEP